MARKVQNSWASDPRPVSISDAVEDICNDSYADKRSARAMERCDEIAKMLGRMLEEFADHGLPMDVVIRIIGSKYEITPS